MVSFFPGRASEFPEVERGALLIWSEDQWWERWGEVLRLSNGNVLTLIVLYSILLIIAIGESLVFVIFDLVFISLMIFYLYWSNIGVRDWSKKGLVVPGVYERGVQLSPSGEFVTYWEMDHIKRGKLIFNKMMVIRSRFGPRTWRVPYKFLGADGILEVHRRLASRDLPARAPRLIVYGSDSR